MSLNTIQFHIYNALSEDHLTIIVVCSDDRLCCDLHHAWLTLLVVLLTINKGLGGREDLNLI
jgi:hypothetical protein